MTIDKLDFSLKRDISVRPLCIYSYKSYQLYKRTEEFARHTTTFLARGQEKESIVDYSNSDDFNLF